MTQYWLFKSEPDVYSIDQLKEDTKKYGGMYWEGVRNYQARNFMRQCKAGDLILYYHSNCKPPGIVGIAKVVKEAYPDPVQFDKKNKYYDHKSSPENPRWSVVDVAFVKKFTQKISLDELRSVPELAKMIVVRKGNRLSITPVTKKEFNFIISMPHVSSAVLP